MNKKLALILLIIPLFIGYKLDDHKIAEQLGYFPWDMVPDYFPYEIDDTLIMRNSDIGIELLPIVGKDISVSFQPFEPVGSQPLFTNHPIASEVAEKIVKMVALGDEHQTSFLLYYRCIRNDYMFLCRYNNSNCIFG